MAHGFPLTRRDSSREQRIYQRYLIEEKERFSEEALALDEDEMREYIEATSKRKEAMWEERRHSKKPRIDPNHGSATPTTLATSSSPAPQPSASASNFAHVDSARLRSSPRQKRGSSPDAAEQTSLSRYAMNPKTRSPKPVRVLPMTKAMLGDVLENSIAVSGSVSVDAASVTAVVASPPALDSAPAPSIPSKRKGKETLAPVAIRSSSSRAAVDYAPAETSRSPAPKKVKRDPDSSSRLLEPSTSKLSSSTAVKKPSKDTKVTVKPPTAREIAKERKAREAARKQREAMEKELTHAEYIAYLPQKFKKRENVLAGVTIFHAHLENPRIRASETARKRYDIIWTLGADIVPELDTERVTHIVTAAETKYMESKICAMSGVKNVTELPERIRTLDWKWVAYAKHNNSRVHPAHEALHEAFPQRIVVPKSSKFGRRAEKERDSRNEHDSSQETSDEEQDARIESQATVPPAAGPSRSASSVGAQVAKDDPLAEFYDQAKYEAEDAVSGDEDEVDVHAPPEVLAQPETSSKKRKAKGFQCDNVGGHLMVGAHCANEDVVEKFEELMRIHETRKGSGDMFRVILYRQVIADIRRHPTRFRSAAEALKLRSVGEKTANKIMEIINTGGLQRLETERGDGMDVIHLFRGIYSVGSKIAADWYAQGLRTLDDVRERKAGIKLSPAMEIGLRYYDDLNDRMPRIEAGEIFGMIKQRALDIDPNLSIEIMGSYRRRKETCGDIDILITRDTSDGKTHAGVLKKLLRVLHADGILTEDLGQPHDMSALEAKYMGICRRDATSKRRRIDILTIPFEQWGGALIYFTGDDIFNRSMRLKANKMGLSLNQRGLYRNVIRDPSNRTNKLDKGELFVSKTEKDIFDALGVPWQEPWERVRSG